MGSRSEYRARQRHRPSTGSRTEETQGQPVEAGFVATIGLSDPGELSGICWRKASNVDCLVSSGCCGGRLCGPRGGW